MIIEVILVPTYKWKMTFILEGLNLKEIWKRNNFIINPSGTSGEKKAFGNYNFETTSLQGDMVDKIALEELNLLLDAIAVVSYDPYTTGFIKIKDIKIKCINSGELIKAGIQHPCEWSTKEIIYWDFNSSTMNFYFNEKGEMR